jgi:hypothetical protein
MATWDEIDPDDVEGSLKKILNNVGFRELRRSLTVGRLPEYCLGTQSCPITKATRLSVRD